MLGRVCCYYLCLLMGTTTMFNVVVRLSLITEKKYELRDLQLTRMHRYMDGLALSL